MRKLINLILPTLMLAGCGEKTMTEFDWLASESSPKYYPMEVIKGTFHFQQGGGVYVPSGSFIYELPWGEYHSVHISGAALKPVPNQLSITFFSSLVVIDNFEKRSAKKFLSIFFHFCSIYNRLHFI